MVPWLSPFSRSGMGSLLAKLFLAAELDNKGIDERKKLSLRAKAVLLA